MFGQFKKPGDMKKVKNLLSKYPLLGSLMFLLASAAFFTLKSPTNRSGKNIFISWDNCVSILQSSAGISIGAFAMTLVLVSGGLDLSAGATIGLTGAVAGHLMYFEHMTWYVAFIAALLTGVLGGVLNSILIVELKLPPFLATLGMAGILTGLAYLISTGSLIPIKDPTFLAIFGYKRVAGFPVLAIWTLVFLAFFYVVIRRTKLGRRAQAVGGNEITAVNSGVNIRQVKYSAYCLMGMAAAIVSMTIGGRLQSAIPTNGSGYELQFIIAAVLGGTGFAGTGGNVFGTLLGSLVLAVFSNGLNLLGINSYLIQILQGIVIIAAIVSAFAYSKKKT